MSFYEHKNVENDVLEFWKKDRTYEKAKKKSSKGKKFYFIDGPPYATGSIHMGTAWNKVIKDAYLRYFRMTGRCVWDQPGYDTHGTPIETKVEKELGFRSKKDIEAYGIGRFVGKCREFATRYIDVMNGQFANLGVWMDWKRPYLTLDNQYIEGAWYTFKHAFRAGFLYKGKYPVHVCPRCETVVAYNEIEYTRQTDMSIYVKLRLAGEKNKYLIVWTTTPWTLPGNMGVMVHPTFRYVEAELGNGETWIVAKERLQNLMNAVEAGYTVVREFPGSELEGLRYEGPLHENLKLNKKDTKDAYRVILSDRYVHLEDGTGLVHTAPGHGKEDFEEGMKAGLPAICPVGIDGRLTEEAGKYAGKKARVVDEEIVRDLQQTGMLVYKHPYTHDYPVCWRCASPLLQVGIPQWFFKVSAIRDKLLSENRKVNWVPGWAGERFNDWLENLGDWPISRQRYWGIPLPIWECSCGNIDVIGSFKELKDKSGLKSEIDFHRPAIDKVEIKCVKCRKPMKRVPDVLDVWFDSGVCTWASLGYPRKKALFKSMWPTDFQVEGPDQFRGWWNSQIITSVLTFGKAPFRNILLHGFVMDVKGIKLSKSLGNFIDPKQVLDRYGRDVLRFYLLNNPLWNDFYFSWDDIGEVNRMFTVFWNSCNFVKTYAPKKPAKKPPLMKIEDKWIISRVNSLMSCANHVESFEIHRLVQSLRDFILNDFSRFYIKSVRDRVSPWYAGKDKAAAEYTLNYVLENLVRMMAPITPLVADWVYRDMYSRESVHLCRWPSQDMKLTSKGLENDMRLVDELLEAMNSARHEKKVKLRWPLKEVMIETKNEKEIDRIIRNFGELIRNMGNVKEIKVARKKMPESREFSLGRLSLGEVLQDEALLRELTRQVQIARKGAKLMVKDRISLVLDSDEKTAGILKRHEKELMAGTGSQALAFGKISGKANGELVFESSKIRFGFRKAK